MPATELSGFGLADDMSDTLVIAISQSGTTTDTNRTVDLVRARGATSSPSSTGATATWSGRSDGVLLHLRRAGRGDERASTKAFYAQVAAGLLLAVALADVVGCGDGAATDGCWRPCGLPDGHGAGAGPPGRDRPDRSDGGAAATLLGRRRQRTNRIAAAEVRIKLSELCYKSIACDATEDKKHIDLSSEPLILVCAAGLHGPNADDVAKEVAIYRAHKAAPIVIVADGDGGRFRRRPAT